MTWYLGSDLCIQNISEITQIASHHELRLLPMGIAISCITIQCSNRPNYVAYNVCSVVYITVFFTLSPRPQTSSLYFRCIWYQSLCINLLCHCICTNISNSVYLCMARIMGSNQCMANEKVALSLTAHTSCIFIRLDVNTVFIKRNTTSLWKIFANFDLVSNSWQNPLCSC